MKKRRSELEPDIKPASRRKPSGVSQEVTIRRPVESDAYPFVLSSEQKECSHDLSDKISQEEKRIGKYYKYSGTY